MTMGMQSAPDGDEDREMAIGSAPRNAWRRWVPGLCIALASCLLPYAASADQTSNVAANPTPAPSASPSPAPVAGGWRQRLQAEGVTLRADYLSETAANTSGGKHLGSAYAQQLRAGFDLDLGKLLGDQGGTFHFTLNDRLGTSVSATDIGNKLAVQQIYGAGQNFRLGELSFDQYLDQRTFNFKVGFWAWGNDFGLTTLLCNFENNGFCGHPQSMPNDSGWSDYPIAKWGARIRANLTKQLYVQTGVFQVNPAGSSAPDGFYLGFHGSTGAIYPVEVGWTPGTSGTGLPGEYKIGAYYDASHVSNIAYPKVLVDGRSGEYVLASQMIVPNAGRPGGLWVFAQGTTDDVATSLIKAYLDGGVVLTAPFAGRDRDSFALGLVRADVNPKALALKTTTDLASGEEVAEMNYGYALSRNVQLRPDVQYVMNPGAFAYKKIENAWVYAVEAKVTF
jgi:porin